MMLAALVGLGGMAGALARFAVDKALEVLRARRRHSVPPKPPFPGGTLVVNILGSGGIGVLWGLLLNSTLDADRYAVWAAGLAGGLTTFSTFTVAAVSLWAGRRQLAAVVHVVSNIGCGLAAGWLGLLATGAV
ncbi:camphor resistance protein CrcB [Arthrobacter subterraneus]|uniref:Fluoride-specific ion channel FluC n=1 Tax=Arthrobacter subterraneus TaxID=335973 RepID=A0A1G8FXQ6_9MICC|nr:CrcB family protein [Arthrobacter subterraneus]SDH86934.1 camphor resistance protein CrcB [Arthrobacter subterraneus]